MKESLLFSMYLGHFVLISSYNVILDSVIRHDRKADLRRFHNSPHHGYFIMEDRNNLTYTIMATGERRGDRGQGRVFYFSSPQPLNGTVIGDNNHDNALKITKSRDLVKQYLGSNLKYWLLVSSTLLYLSWTVIINVCIPNISVNSIQICLCQPWR